MNDILKTLNDLKNMGCCGIKLSFEDEGALLNEIITMRSLTSKLNIELSIKIGGCESKRDIMDCIFLDADCIVAPMIESKFAVDKFIKSLDVYNYKNKKGINIETINAYNNFNDIKNNIESIEFITFGRVDFITSLNKDREYIEENDIYNYVSNIFKQCKEINKKCYLGGAISIKSKKFISNLINEKLIDNFETRYIIFDVNLIDFNEFENLIYLANLFEVKWLKYISERYYLLANKDVKRIKMIEERININKII